MKKIILPIVALALCGGSLNSWAQSSAVAAAPGLAGNSSAAANANDTPVDGYFNTTAFENATPFNYPNVDKNNVRLYKRIWRDIDLADPRNQSFAMPGSSLIEIILNGVKSGSLTAYDPIPTAENPSGDGFKTKMTYDQLMNKLADSVLVPKFDAQGNQTSSQMVRNDFDPSKITKFRIKEDIFYDKQRAKTETRIVGVAPLMNLESNGQSYGTASICWLYFPQLRSSLAKVDVSDPDRNMLDMSMDDLFVQRKFAGMIVKESNALGQVIKDYTHDENKEREAMLAEQKIQAYKNKIWQYGNSNDKKAADSAQKPAAAAQKSSPDKNSIAKLDK